MILVENITKTFKLYKTPADRLKEIILRRSYHRNFKALADVSFNVEEGQTLGIIGRNGSGKSTLLKIITGVLMPDSGTVNIDGKVTGLLELGTGFNQEFSGLANIYTNGIYLGLSRQEIDKRLDEIIAFTELGAFINEPMKTYSSGMVMRLAFSVAIHADPKAFVVDEALSVGDAYFQQKCMTKIKQFKMNGGSIVFVSHDMNAVKMLCDQAILMEDGLVIEEGTPEAIVNSYNFLVAKQAKGEEIKYIGKQKSAGYGNKKVTIDEVFFQDGNGGNVSVISSGSPARIQVSASASELVKDLSIGILIRDKFGQDIFGTNTFHLHKQVIIEPGKSCRLTYKFAEFNLGPGKYTLTVAAHTQDTHIQECFHWVDRVINFEVVASGDYIFTGIARLKPALIIENG